MGDDIDAQLPTIGLEYQLRSGRLDPHSVTHDTIGVSRKRTSVHLA